MDIDSIVLKSKLSSYKWDIVGIDGTNDEKLVLTIRCKHCKELQTVVLKPKTCRYVKCTNCHVKDIVVPCGSLKDLSIIDSVRFVSTRNYNQIMALFKDSEHRKDDVIRYFTVNKH